jgi:hypothetical protein
MFFGTTTLSFSFNNEIYSDDKIRYAEGVYEAMCAKISKGVMVYDSLENPEDKRTAPIGKSLKVENGEVFIEVFDANALLSIKALGEDAFFVGTCLEGDVDDEDTVKVINSADLQFLVLFADDIVSYKNLKDASVNVPITKENSPMMGANACISSEKPLKGKLIM